jgi:hypothetical protein
VRSAGKVPTMARGARSKANLRRGGPGRPKRTEDEKAREKEAQKTARRLLTDKRYLAELACRLNEGRCQPGVEVAIWQYAYGKPKELMEVKDVTPVRIQHEYAKS